MEFDASQLQLVDISLPLDESYEMHTPEGVQSKKFSLELLKEHDAPTGAGQVVRGMSLRLHHGTHVDAPEHFVRDGAQLHELDLSMFFGPVVIADVTNRGKNEAITPDDLQQAVGDEASEGDRLLVRTDWTKHYGEPRYKDDSPFITPAAVDWCVEQGFVLVGMDFDHTKDAEDSPSKYYATRTFCEQNVITMGYIANLDKVPVKRALLVALPLAIQGVEASPVRAVAAFDQSW